MRGTSIAIGVAAAAMACAITPPEAHAGGVVEEVGAGSVPATAAAPGSRWLSDKLAGLWDVTERWQLRIDLSSTRMYSDAVDSRRGDLYLGALAATFSADDHWSLRLTGGWSPEATTQATVPVGAQGLFSDAMQADAQLRAAVSSLSAGAGIDYDAASDGVHSISVSLSVAATYASSQQEITGAAAPGGEMLDAEGVRVHCQLQACSREVAGALIPQWVQLGQFALGASLTDTVDRDTDLSLDASYFRYDRDPMQAGYFALASVGLGTLGSATGVAPLRDTVTPSITQRWGNVGASASVSYTEYADNQGLDLSAGLRVQYKLVLSGAQRLKLYTKLAAGLHVDASAEHPRSGSASLGAQYSW